MADRLHLRLFCRSFERLLFLIEQAHWFYEVDISALATDSVGHAVWLKNLSIWQSASPRTIRCTALTYVSGLRVISFDASQDFAREADPDAQLASLSLKRFATLIFKTCPGLQPYSGALDAIYKQFNDYKQVISGIYCGCWVVMALPIDMCPGLQPDSGAMNAHPEAH